MKFECLGEPCRNFNVMDATTIMDPLDGRQKVVLANFVTGGTGNLIFIDPQTGEGESVMLPGDEGGEGLLNMGDRRLLVGTSAVYGYLLNLDLAARRWAEPLRDPKETYIWNLCLADDGMVYGGTWPGCVLLRYDPQRHTLENLGRMSDNPANQYTRLVYGGLPGCVLVYCMAAEPHLTLWDIRAGKARRFGRPGASVRQITPEFLCTVTDGKLDFYDPRTLEPIERDLSDRLTPPWTPPYPGTGPAQVLRDGRTFAVRGQEYLVASDGDQRPALKRIPTEPPATAILGLACAPDGTVWGSSGFGQTIFRHDPRTGGHWNSPGVCSRGGEVYGMVFAAGRLFMAAYSGGDHVVYDPALPWDQLGNVNPRTLEPAGPNLVRPQGRSVIGPDGNVWTGWMARYGVYGGGLSRVDVRTLAVTCWHDPVPGQCVNGLAADDRYLYFTTSGEANGLPSKEEPFHFVVWSPAGGIVRDQAFERGDWLGGVLAAGGRVLVRRHQAVSVFDPAGMRFEREMPLPETASAMVALEGGRSAGLFCGEAGLLRLDPATGETARLCDLPPGVRSTASGPDGEVYFTSGARLYRLRA
jgi:hypothetical protein